MKSLREPKLNRWITQVYNWFFYISSYLSIVLIFLLFNIVYIFIFSYDVLETDNLGGHYGFIYKTYKEN